MRRRAGGAVCVVGSINVDLGVTVSAFPAPGETVLGGEVTTGPGGKGANQAVAAALAGASVAMVGAVGEDRFAAEGLSGLRRAQVDTGAVHSRPGASGTALITVDAQGENTIVVAQGANAKLSVTDVEEAAEKIRSADVLLVQGEVAAEVVEEAARIARSAGAARGGRPRLVFNCAPVLRVDADVLRHADPLIVNLSEAREVVQWLRDGYGEEPAGVSCPAELTGAGGLPDAEGPDAETAGAVGAVLPVVSRIMRRRPVLSLVVTLGRHGSLIAEGPGSARYVPACEVPAVDTTGAGDMYVGTFAAQLAAGGSLAEAAESASVAAAGSVRFEGAQDSYFRAYE